MRVAGDIVELPDPETFRRKISNKPSKYSKVVVLFSAVWCPPCRMIKSDFIELAFAYRTNDIVFVEVDVDKHREISQECHVHSLPTFLCFAQGDVVDEVIGPNKMGLLQAVANLNDLQLEETPSTPTGFVSFTMGGSGIKRALKKLMHMN